MPISAIPARASTHRRQRRALALSAAFALAVAVFVTVRGALPALASEASGGWVAPLPGSLNVVGPFDPPSERWLAGHRGVDLSAPSGTTVRSAGSGVVTFAGTVAGRGVLTIAHASGRTTYEPIEAAVDKGQAVLAGDAIGVVGGGGHCSHRCLHWGYLRAEAYLDPLSLLHPVPPVLKPLSAQPSSTTSGSHERLAQASPVGAVPRAEVAKTAVAPQARPAAETGQVDRSATVSAIAVMGPAAAGSVAIWQRRRIRRLRR